MIGEETILTAVKKAVEEEFGGSYGGSDIANRVLDILIWGPES